MRNREIYIKDPITTRLLNNGVAKVADDLSAEEQRTLRYELETFVCEGEYERGLERILNSFLGNLDASEQPGVWVSGFFGSGKSHLVKMLRALWEDFVFPEDQATARGLVELPETIEDHLRELSTASRRAGGLHAAAGTLGAGAGDNVRPALLSIVFRSAGLPEAYPQARFVMWLKREGYLDTVRGAVEEAGRNWKTELNNMYMSRHIAEAIIQADPGFADNPKNARIQLREQFPNRDDVTNDQMVDALHETLSQDGRIPLTLIVLDEVQQYIGDDADRTYKVQETVEVCCKKFEGRLLFVGTGQTALAGTPSLQRLMGRFPAKVELSDADVDTVIRKIILAKKPEVKPQLEQVATDHMGEISRHLVGTEMGHRPEDMEVLIPDYPILPVRRRFWERCLRSLDPTGTQAQLRNQLSIVLEAARRTAEEELGCVVPGDFVFDEIASNLLQTGSLPKEVYERIQSFRGGDPDDVLKARICALAFLIGKLPRDRGADLGVRATEGVLADLLVEDLRQGSGELRQRLPKLLDDLVEDSLLMQIDEEYRLQTREGAAWNDEFRSKYTVIQNDPQMIANYRIELFHKEVRERLSETRILQGRCKEPRKPELFFGTELPDDQDAQLYVWVRDGWDTEENTVLAEARRAGNQSPTLFVYIPRHHAEELRATLAELHAAEETLNIRGLPTTPEGIEARNAMLTRQSSAEERLHRILRDEIFPSAVVFQGGGQDIAGMKLASKVEEGLDSALKRLYLRFDVADHENWSRVIERAKRGAGDALAAVDHTGDVDQHEVCKTILRFVGAGKTGKKVRDEFGGKGYGWPRDAIDGALYALVVSGHLCATDKDRNPVELSRLTQSQVTRTSFKTESATVTAGQRLKVRKLLQDLGLPTTPGEESNGVAQAVPILRQLAEAAGGDPPRPERPSAQHIDELSSLAGNELLIAIAERQEELVEQAQVWRTNSEAIAQRWSRWEALQALCEYASDLPEAQELEERIEAIRTQRLLLEDPPPVPPICDALTQHLRTVLTQAYERYTEVYGQEMNDLEADSAWSQLEGGQQEAILRDHGLAQVPTIATGNEAEVLSSLSTMPLSTWQDRIEALPVRFGNARLAAARLTTRLLHRSI